MADKYIWKGVTYESLDKLPPEAVADLRRRNLLPKAKPEVNATDKAKELAEQHGIDLGTVTGSGVDGRITVADVEGLIA